MFKLIAIDMDGTLLRSDHTVSQYTKDILKKFSDNGTRIVISTGRPLNAVIHYINDIGIFSDDDFVICNNGASIYSIKDFSPIYSNYIDINICKEIFDLGKSFNVAIEAFSHDFSIASEKHNHFDNGDNNDLPLKVHYVNTSDDLSNFDNLFKIMFIADEDKINQIIPLVPSRYIDNYNAIHSLPKIFEFLNKDCGKGFTIANLCNILNIDINHVVSFGDAPNDVDMIKMCGTGVAMGNAYDEIKEIANFITKSNDEDGVAYFLEQYLS